MINFENSEVKPFIDHLNGKICQTLGPKMVFDQELQQQTIKNVTCNGLGRIIFSNFTLEGQFKNDSLHGYGRKSLPNGTVEFGYFQNSKYVAANKTMFDLQTLFSTNPDQNILTPVQLQTWTQQG
jgi:hypothetical protein